MARRGAMTKNPVLRGEARKSAQRANRAAAEGQPELSPPVTAKPKETKGERLSPGVYRGSQGNLLDQRGRQIQRQPQPPMQTAPLQNLPGVVPSAPQDQSQRFMDMLGQGYNPTGGGNQSEQQMPVGGGMMGDPNYYGGQGQQIQQGINWAPGFGPDQTNMPQDKMYRWPQGPQMPQPSANMGGQYRLSPGVYGTRDQAMQQYNQQMQQAYQPMAMPQVRRG